MAARVYEVALYVQCISPKAEVTRHAKRDSSKQPLCVGYRSRASYVASTSPARAEGLLADESVPQWPAALAVFLGYAQPPRDPAYKVPA